MQTADSLRQRSTPGSKQPIHLLLRRAQANAVLMGRAEALRDRAAGVLLRPSQSHR